MVEIKSKMYNIEMRGRLACFTAVESKIERVSYPIPTPSAVEGALSGVMGKHEIQWHLSQCRVLSKIRHTPVRRNELKEFGNNPVYIENNRAQRTTLYLKDVHYVFSVFMTIRPDAFTRDIVKYESMFERRMEGGQFEYYPYFGLRELAVSRYALVDDLSQFTPIPFSQNFGRMFYGHQYRDRRVVSSKFWEAKIVRGIVNYPSRDEIFGEIET